MKRLTPNTEHYANIHVNAKISSMVCMDGTHDSSETNF